MIRYIMDNLTKYIGDIQLWIIMKGKNMVIKRHFKKLITTTLVGITVLTPINKLSYAQSKNLIFNNINIEQGISQSTIEDIFQDSEGYIWYGTEDGLCCDDGYAIHTYRSDFRSPNLMSSNQVTCITEDKHGRIWLKTNTVTFG